MYLSIYLQMHLETKSLAKRHGGYIALCKNYLKEQVGVQEALHILYIVFKV